MGANERIGINLAPEIVALDPKWLELIDESWLENLDCTTFLTRCRSGAVNRSELNSFLIQQQYYSKHFTRYLCALLSNISNEHDRQELTENLLEETGFIDNSEIPHSQIYREMMIEMGVPPESEPILASTQFLIDTMYECCRSANPLIGLAAMCLGAEAIVPHVYSQVIRGFIANGELSSNLKFFHIHVGCDDEHAITMRNIINRELSRDRFQLSLLKMTAVRLLQARTLFFEGISSRAAVIIPTIGVRHDALQFQGLQ